MAQIIDILTPITNWVNADWYAIQGQANQPGSWELWTQGQISGWFDNNTPFVVTRSPNAYSNGAPADFIVYAGQAFQDAVIELKVWNQVSETSGAFATRLLADYGKIRTRDIAAGFVMDKFWSIGISGTAGRGIITPVLEAANAGYQRQEFEGFDIWANSIDR